MTTEEALEIADSVQFDEDDSQDTHRDRRGKPKAKNRPSDYKRHEWAEKDSAQEYWGDPITKSGGQKEHFHPKSNRRRKKQIVVNVHGGNVHMSDADSLDAQKSRFDAADRSAMRRHIERAPLHPAIKARLLAHSQSVQFDDEGTEQASIPLKWIVDAINALQAAQAAMSGPAEPMPDEAMPEGPPVQMAHPLGIQPSPVRVRDTGLLKTGRPYDLDSREVWQDAKDNPWSSGVASSLLAHPILAVDRAMQGKGEQERARQEALNSRLRQNDALDAAEGQPVTMPDWFHNYEGDETGPGIITDPHEHHHKHSIAAMNALLQGNMEAYEHHVGEREKATDLVMQQINSRRRQ